MSAIANPDNCKNLYYKYVNNIKLVRFGLLRPLLRSEKDSKINLFRWVLWSDERFIFKRTKTILLKDIFPI